MFLFYTFLCAFVLVTASGFKCTEEGYAAYLKSHPLKNPSSSASYSAEHMNVFLANCRKAMYRKARKQVGDITALTDWSDTELDVLGDLVVKYNQVITLNDPVDVKNVTFNIEVPNREFTELSEANEPQKGCATSWVTAAIEVAEAALDYSVKLSARQLFECLPKSRGYDDGCNGVYPDALMKYLLEVGLVEEDKFTGCESLDGLRHYTFYYTTAEPPNASGLMNLIAEGQPVFAMIAVDLKRLRYVKDMSTLDEYIKCGDYQPSLYGIVSGYNYDKDDMKNSWWEFTSRIVPEEEVIIKMPMTENMENANYAGIAAYAFTLTLVEDNTPKPIYDPFIFGDNTNFADGSTCIDEIPSDIEVLKRYLAIRDEYPEYALKHTRVLALAGMNKEAIALLIESLKKQEKSDSPIDLYFLSDYVGARYTTNELLPEIASLSCYTYPSRMVIAGGNIQTTDLMTLIYNMNSYASSCDGFKNLKYLEVSGHRLAVNMTNAREGEKNSVLSVVQNALCESFESFPVLETINLNQNYYMLYNDRFDVNLTMACKELTRRNSSITVTADMYDEDIRGKWICRSDDDGTGTRFNYYTMEEYEQCRYTWNWEYRDLVSQSQGPYPKVGLNPECASAVRRLEDNSLDVPSQSTSIPTEVGGVIYDPFILGDNSFISQAIVENQCSINLPSYMDNLKEYLSIRDQYPDSALMNTRVLALMGMTKDAVELLEAYLQNQLNDDSKSIDMYFYSDHVHNYILGSEMAEPLISLSQYTRPSKIVFSDGTFGQQGLYNILDWMLTTREEGYFLHLKSLKITRHRLNHIGVNEKDKQDEIIRMIQNICEDKELFPDLTEINFDNNGFHENESGKAFQQNLKHACDGIRSDDNPITISANDYDSGSADANVFYICPSVIPQESAYDYYLGTDDENNQCKNTWHWDLFGKNRVYGGPYPVMNDQPCRPIN